MNLHVGDRLAVDAGNVVISPHLRVVTRRWYPLWLCGISEHRLTCSESFETIFALAESRKNAALSKRTNASGAKILLTGVARRSIWLAGAEPEWLWRRLRLRPDRRY